MMVVKKYLEKCDHHDKEHDRKLSYSKGLNVACKSVMKSYMDGDIQNLSVGRGSSKNYRSGLVSVGSLFENHPLPSQSVMRVCE